MTVRPYISIGLHELGMPYADETMDEEASCEAAKQFLEREYQGGAEFHVDWGEGETLLIVPGYEPSARLNEFVGCEVAKKLLDNKEKWVIPADPYYGTYLQWLDAGRMLRGVAYENFEDYFAYSLRKMEENHILINEDTMMTLYFGPSLDYDLYNAMQVTNIRKLPSERRKIHPNTIYWISYPLTAKETGCERDRDCDMFRSLTKIGQQWYKAAEVLFPNATVDFSIHPKEKEKTGSLTFFDHDGMIITQQYELERAFFSLGSEVLLNRESWYV